MSLQRKNLWHTLEVEEVAQLLDTNLEKGLSEEEVVTRRKEFGLNEIPKEKPITKKEIFLDQFRSPLVYILVIAGLVTIFLREFTDALVIFMAVGLNTVVGFFQENKASNALKKLKEILSIKALCFRDGQEKEIDQTLLVPGDIIELKTGNKVPADARIISSTNLKINEAPLTGEWLSAEKKPLPLNKDLPVADRENMVYLGTTIEEGEGRAIVIDTGAHTEIGRVARLVKETKEEKTPYQKKIIRFSRIIGLIIAFISLAIFIIGLIAGQDVTEMFLTAIAIVVAAIPEGLPIATTVIMALGMQAILRKKGLVRKLASAETLGSTSVICTDKTLTLTEGKMALADIRAEDNIMTLQAAVLANEAFIENPEAKKENWKLRGRPTDRALLLAGEEHKLYKPDLEKKFPKIDEIPFDSQHKFIATLHQSEKEGQRLLFLSGAPEKIIALANEDKQREKDLEEMTGQGLRVIALATKEIEASEESEVFQKNSQGEYPMIKGLRFLGFIGFKDPLRQETKEAFDICRQAGMRPVIVTGDHLLTAAAVAKELNLPVKKKNLVEGKDLDNMSDKELAKKLKDISVYARVEPRHKLRIIRAWQDKNEVVAMTGDGINDTPALKRADIGVSLGSGTDVAKEVSDLILLNDNFSIIVAAINEGRKIIDNIRKSITYLLSDSFTEVIVIGASIVTGLPLAISAVQILWVNLIEDGLPSIALAFEPGEKDIMKQKPYGHKISLLTKEMKVIIFIIGIITDLILLGLFFWLWKENHDISYVRTMVFASLTIDSIFYIFSCKSLRKNIWHINIFSNKYLIGAWIISFLALVTALYVPFFNYLLETVPLSLFDWYILLALGLSEIILIEITKHYFIVRHQTQK